jgi:hypothetical protein
MATTPALYFTFMHLMCPCTSHLHVLLVPGQAADLQRKAHGESLKQMGTVVVPAEGGGRSSRVKVTWPSACSREQHGRAWLPSRKSYLISKP